MEENIKEIIAKVRSIGKTNPEIKDLVKQEVSVKLTFKEGRFVLENITFGKYFNVLVVVNDGIFKVPEYGKDEKILEYKDWSDLFLM